MAIARTGPAAYAALLAACVLFAVAEYYADSLLTVISPDIYFLARVVVGAALTGATILFLRMRSVVLGQSSSPATYFLYLASLRRRWEFWACIIFWSVSTVGLTLAFRYADFIMAAYLFFAIHPVWTLLLKLLTGERFDRLPWILGSLALSLCGVLIFLLRKSGLTHLPGLSSNDVWTYLAGFAGGFAYAITNFTFPLINRLRPDASPRVRQTKELADQFVHMSRYLFGLFAAYPLIVFTWIKEGSPLFVKWGALVPGNQLLDLFDRYGIGWIGAGVLIVCGLIACSALAFAANLLLGVAFNRGNSATVSALELLSIPIAAVVAWLHGAKEADSNLWLATGGLAVQVLFSIIAVMLIERPKTPASPAPEKL